MWWPPGLSCTGWPAGSASDSMARIFITSPCMAISCTSATPAAGELTPTSCVAAGAVSVMKAPVAFCPGTEARAQAPSTLTASCASACVAVAASSKVAARVLKGVVVIMFSLSNASNGGTRPRL